MSEEIPKKGKGGRKPKAGGNADLANQLRELRNWTNLSDAEFALRVNDESKATIGLLLTKIREAVPTMSASQASISYGILSDKRLAQDLRPQPTTLVQNNVTINGYSKEDLRAILSGKMRPTLPTSSNRTVQPVQTQGQPSQTEQKSQ